MIQARIFMAIAAATALSAGVSLAQNGLEKCKIIKDGNPDAWLMVPKGQCKKINTGDLSGVSNVLNNIGDRQI